jgi:hypothetical protein
MWPDREQNHPENKLLMATIANPINGLRSYMTDL